MKTSLMPARLNTNRSLFDLFFTDIDKFFDASFPDFPKFEVQRYTEGYPVSNVFTNKDGDFKIEIAVTGFNKDQITLNLEDGCLIVTGDNKQEQKEEDEWKLVTGRLKHTSFEKRFRLSNRLDTEKADVTLVDGVLTVTIPAKEQLKPKQLTIK